MATYVARVERDGKTVLERADVTVEILDDGGWRARFLVPSGIRFPQETELGLAFADGRHGRARIDHIHPAAPKSGARLVELSGVGPLG